MERAVESLTHSAFCEVKAYYLGLQTMEATKERWLLLAKDALSIGYYLQLVPIGHTPVCVATAIRQVASPANLAFCHYCAEVADHLCQACNQYFCSTCLTSHKKEIHRHA